MRRTASLAACLAVLALGVAACGDDANEGSIRFYESPGAKDVGDPGDVIADEPIELAGLDGEGHRVTYASTTPRGDVVHVTGVLIAPPGEAPEGGRPVAVWGHPTVGVGTDCAPSLEEPFPLDGAQQLLDAGFVVAAPDYDGLGSEGTHPYLVGESEGRSVLDIARAARELSGNDTIVAWGHSQGGHAVLWARSIADDYAPDLDLRATAAAAPPTDLSVFLDPGFTDPAILPLTAQTAIAWGTVHENAGLAPLATEALLESAAEALSTCFVEIAAVAADVDPSDVWAAGPDDVESWRVLTGANSVDPDRGSGPVYLSHGDPDPLVPIEGSVALADDLCARGETVARRFDDSWDHVTSYTEPRGEMLAWLIDAVEGSPPAEC